MVRKQGKAARRQEVTSVKLCVRIPLDLAQRLGVMAAMERKSQSALTATALRGFLAGVRLPSVIRTAEQQEGPQRPSDAVLEGNAGQDVPAGM
jgi:hypothetical protein